jgi:hypothetical protein
LALVLSDAEYQKAMAHCGIGPADRGPWIRTSHANATAHYLNNPKGEQVCIVALRLVDDVTPIQIAALLVHEAVHVFQEFCTRIGECSPSPEFEAYSIQTISQRLMQAYAERIK